MFLKRLWSWVFSGEVPRGLREEQRQLHPHHLRPGDGACEEEHAGLQRHQLPRHPEARGGDGEEARHRARPGDNHR